MYNDKGRFTKSLLQWMRADRFIGKIDTAEELTFLVGHNKFSDWNDDVYKGMLGYGHGRGRGLGYKEPDHEAEDQRGMQGQQFPREGSM